MIYLTKSSKADTRTNNTPITKEELMEANNSHINDVGMIMNMLADKIIDIAKIHDYTKNKYIDMQLKAYNDAINGVRPFIESDWYLMHVKAERHHLYSDIKDDINLLDILEMLSDICAAALARSGKYAENIEIDSNILAKAVENTVKLINNNIKLS